LRVLKTLGTVCRYLLHSPNAGSPIVAYWMITKECNLRCKMCTYWKGIYENELNTDDVKRILDKLKNAGISILSLTGGEPLMRKDISEILNYAKFECEIDYVRLQTNGVLLTKNIIDSSLESLDDIWLSLDGIGKTHDIIRGIDGTFSKIEKNIEYLNSREDRPNLIINTVVNKYNVEEISKIVELAEEWKATQLMFHHVIDVKDDVHTKQFSSEEDLSTMMIDEIVSDIPTYVDPWLLSGGLSREDRKGCLILYTNVMINPSGEVVPCGIFDNVVLGNLLREDFENIWNGDKMRNFRKSVWDGRKECSKCCVPRTTLRSRILDKANLRRIL